MFHSFFFYRESCCCFWSKRDSSFLLACKSARVEAKQGARALLLLCLLYRDRVSNMKWPNAWYVRQWNLVIVLYFRFLKSKCKNSGKGTLKRMKFFVTKTRLYCIIMYIFFLLTTLQDYVAYFLKSFFDFRCLRNVAITPVQPGRRRGWCIHGKRSKIVIFLLL